MWCSWHYRKTGSFTNWDVNPSIKCYSTQQLKGTKYWDMQQHGWISKKLLRERSYREKSKYYLKPLSMVWFQLHKISRK
jgi:hypothetical protein